MQEKERECKRGGARGCRGGLKPIVVRGDEAGKVGDEHDGGEVLHIGHLESAQQRA